MKIFSKIIVLILLIFNSSIAQNKYDLNATKEFMIFGSGGLMTGLAVDFNQYVYPVSDNEITKLKISDVNFFDRNACTNYSPFAAELSDYLLAALVISPYALLFDKPGRNNAFSYFLLNLENLFITGSLTSMVKNKVRRFRPYVYNPDVPETVKYSQDSRRSFFSGHSSIAFSSAVFLGMSYDYYYPKSENSKYVWAGSILTASTVSVLRYLAGKHFPSDLVVGALSGSIIGYTIHKIHTENIIEDETKDIPQLNRNYFFSFSFQL